MSTRETPPACRPFVKNAPGKSALILLDFINPLDFPGAERLRPAALAAGERARVLRDAYRVHGAPVIYANDNYGLWRQSFDEVLAHARGARGAELVELLEPGSGDRVVLKPRHSAFYQTSIELLLRDLEVERVVLTGLQADICVLFTAMDAFLRKYEVAIVRDGVASEEVERRDRALAWAERVCDARVCDASELFE